MDGRTGDYSPIAALRAIREWSPLASLEKDLETQGSLGSGLAPFRGEERKRLGSKVPPPVWRKFGIHPFHHAHFFFLVFLASLLAGGRHGLPFRDGLRLGRELIIPSQERREKVPLNSPGVGARDGDV